MKRAKNTPFSDSKKRMRPAISPESRENMLMSLATDLIEQRLRDGTASAQETVAILKQTAAKSRLEREILEKQKELIEAKTESLKSTNRLDELYTKALDAMRRYSGQQDDSGYDY